MKIYTNLFAVDICILKPFKPIGMTTIGKQDNVKCQKGCDGNEAFISSRANIA